MAKEAGVWLTRRRFMGGTAAGAAGALLAHGRGKAVAADEKLNIALIGAGGRGSWFVSALPGMGQKIAAFCDVDASRAGEAFRQFPDVPRFEDFRVMLDRMGKSIDAVVVAAPDHVHAAASAAAMRAGKPVYCEKPLTHSIHEARALGRLAAELKVATQMGNQGTSSEPFRRAVELLRGGVIGPVERVLAWNNGLNGQHTPPAETPDVPDTLNWDLWLGPASWRAYHPTYVRGRWHSWVDFGTGVLGNWACHTLNLPFMALNVGELWRKPQARIEVAAEHGPFNGHTHPAWMKLTWRIPPREGQPAAEVQWINGGGNEPAMIAVRREAEERLGHALDWGDTGEKKWKHWAGVLLIGSKGMIHANAHNMEMQLLPAERFAGAELPAKSLERVPGHEWEWLRAARGGPAAMSNFTDHGGPLTEFVLTGNVACRTGQAVTFDPAACRFINDDKANGLLGREYRKGWSL